VEEQLARGFALLTGCGGKGKWQGAAPFSTHRGGLSLADACSSTSPSPPSSVVVSGSIWWMRLLPSAWELLSSDLRRQAPSSRSYQMV
jgi:hypothetical protein